MATFSFVQLEALALKHGVPRELVPTMAAIALAESGGCQYALAGPQDVRPVKQCVYRRTNGEQSYGLWQINIGVSSPPEPRLFDPDYNAEQAGIRLATQGLTAWSTYTNDAYKGYLAGQPPLPTPQPPSSPGAGDTTGDQQVTQAHGGFWLYQHRLLVTLPDSLNRTVAVCQATARMFARPVRLP